MLSMPETLSLIAPLTPHNGTCGYCGPPGERSVEKTSYHTAECVAHMLSCRASTSLPTEKPLLTLSDLIVRAPRRLTRR